MVGFEMSLNLLCTFPANDSTGKCWDSRRWRIVARSQVTEDVPLKRVLGARPRHSRCVLLCFAVLWLQPCEDLPRHRPAVTGPSDDGLEPLKLESKINLSSWTWWLMPIVYVVGSRPLCLKEAKPVLSPT